MNIKGDALKLHGQWKGKIEVQNTVEIKNSRDLSLAYTPGVAEPCLAIQEDINLSYEYTRKWNLVAVITDGSAVLGLGDIGPEAAMPVMEGKCVLFKTFADIDAFPLCIKSKEIEDIVKTIQLISGSFGGINLEDISAPRCFEIERRLKEECDIPIFHDDQHGTAVVTLAALINALKIVEKDMKDIKIVVNGLGAAGIAIIRLLIGGGFKNIIACDKQGIVYEGRDNQNTEKADIAGITNYRKVQGTLSDAMLGADVFIGVSAPEVLTRDMIKTMAKDPIVFAMANPDPEIMPDIAKEAGARVVGTGRSDFENQINNVLAFPGIFRGAIDTRAKDINDEMKVAAAKAIASLVNPEELTEEYIIPKAFDKRVVPAVAQAVAKAAKESGVARI